MEVEFREPPEKLAGKGTFRRAASIQRWERELCRYTKAKVRKNLLWRESRI